MPRIAYLGPEGTFTEAALLKLSASGLVPGNASSDGITPIPAESTPAALAAVRSGDADYACVPIENSIEGSVCRQWTTSRLGRRRSSPTDAAYRSDRGATGTPASKS